MATGRTTLKTYFESGDKPDQAQFGELIDAFYHKDEDIASVGLKEYDATVAYKTDQGVIYQGELYQFLANHGPAAWDATKVKKIPDQSLVVSGIAGVVVWENADTYNLDDLVSYEGKIYRSKSTNQGKPPPDHIAHWDEINYSPTIKNWQTLSLYPGVMVDGQLEGHLVQYYDQIFESNVHGGWVSIDIEAEIDAGQWRLMGGVKNRHKIPDGDQVNVPPGYTLVIWGNLHIEDGGKLKIHEGGRVAVINGDVIQDGILINEGELLKEIISTS